MKKITVRPVLLTIFVAASFWSAVMDARGAGCVPPPGNLVAWWQAEGDAVDVVGTNEGTVFPGAGFAPGEVGQAFSFSGATNSYIEVPDAPSLRLTNELTIEFWVKRLSLEPPSNPFADYIVEKGGDWTGSTLNYAVALHNPSYNYCLHFVFNGGWRGGGSVADTNFWHHCAIVARNGDTNPVFYVDGVAQPVTYTQGAAAIDLYPSTRPLHIGAEIDPVTGWRYFSRTLIDELSFYNRVLSADEIRAIYLAGSAGKCTAPQPPFIFTQPSGTNIFAGDWLRLKVAVSGAQPLSFQWQKDGSPVYGATASAYTIPNAQATNSGTYSVTITNLYGSVVSSNAVVNVTPQPPIIVSQPAGTNAYVGARVVLQVAVIGSSPFSYKWQKDGNPIPGANDGVYIIYDAQVANSGSYSVIISNAFGFITSSNAFVNIVAPPPCTPAPPGLVAWWRAENNLLDSYDANAGTAYAYLTRPPVPIYSPGKVGLALNFGGIYRVQVPDAPTLRFTNAFSAEAWVYPAPVSSSLSRTIVAKYERSVLYPPGPLLQSTNSSFYFGTTNGSMLYLLVSSNGSTLRPATLLCTNPLPQAQWSHVAATYDGAALRLYINGALATEASYRGNVFAGTTDLGIGGLASTSSYVGVEWPWAGMLDEISLYNRALSPEEIADIYQADISGKCLIPPTIVVQPQSQAIPRGEDVEFAPQVVGAKPLSFQWRFNGQLLAGRTKSNLVIEKVQSNNIGNYSVLITNAVGSVLSADASLTLLAAASCTAAPDGMVSWWPADNSALDAAGTNNGVLAEGASYATGKVASAFAFPGGYSAIRVPDSPSLNFGSNALFSVEGWLKVLPPGRSPVYTNDNVPFFEKRAVNYTIVPGESGYSLSLFRGRLAFWVASTFPIVPRGTPSGEMFISDGPDLRDGMFHHVALSLNRALTNGGNLYVDGLPVLNFDTHALRGSLSNNASLLIGNATSSDSTGTFSGLIDELAVYNRALSGDEIMAIRQAGAAGKCKVAPTILVQPHDLLVRPGGTAQFSVVATGPALRYQWRAGSRLLAGATGSSLTLSNVFSNGLYSVSISNRFGSVLSSNALLSVATTPVARCTNATVAAGPNCLADALIDNGSFGPAGDPVTITQTPPGPYPLGETVVTLTITDSLGGSDSCVGLVRVVDRTPPVITCASNITVEFTSQAGASVTFSATAIDNCSPTVSLLSTPPSGAVFPIGTTTVLSTATDASSNSASCSFLVTVLGAQGVKTNVLVALVGLLPAVDRQADLVHLNQAIQHLAASLQPGLWVDQVHLNRQNGEQDFNEESAASRELGLLVKDGHSSVSAATIRGLIDRIVRCDRLIASVAIAEAAAGGVSSNRLAHANSELTQGDDLAARDQFSAGIEHYRNAWKEAMRLSARLAARLVNSTLRLEASVSPGDTYAIESSTNLVNWVPVGTATAHPDGTLRFDDPGFNPLKTQFYRARLLP